MAVIRNGFQAFTSLLVCLAVFALAYPARAQVLYGSIVGTVQDETGGVVPNATVTIANTSTGQSRETTTTDDGAYLFVDVAAGSYSLTTTAKGFRTSRTNNVEVTINAVARQDMRLRVGERTETVTVEASAIAIQADSADVHVSLMSQQVTQLPLSGYRNYQTLINLVPGATPANYQDRKSTRLNS